MLPGNHISHCDPSGRVWPNTEFVKPVPKASGSGKGKGLAPATRRLMADVLDASRKP